jgi:hypothetical protein
MTMAFKDCYQVLGVERDASADVTKKAFRCLARTHHPDINPAPDVMATPRDAGRPGIQVISAGSKHNSTRTPLGSCRNICSGAPGSGGRRSMGTCAACSRA